MKPVFSVHNLSTFYGGKQVLRDVTFDLPPQAITAIIGPSGCGKTTFLRCLNRLNDLSSDFRLTGSILFHDHDLYGSPVDVTHVRRRVGMVFQKPNPFPKSIFENIAYGLRIHGLRDRHKIAERVQESLTQAALWDEVKDHVHDSALSLSGGQQQRLCIARAIAVAPEVILFDEPCSALDPVATQRIEELIIQLKSNYTIVIVTHNLQQARRIADRCALFHLGNLIEFGPTRQLFEAPEHHITRDYVQGVFG